jgi:hypothetical protein
VSALEFVAGVVSAFFAIGIAVGVIGVVALGAVRERRKSRNRIRARRPPDEIRWGGPPGSGRDDADRPPRWPGGLSGVSAHGD